ncbi:MAG: TldD/PmbA family protein [Gammaproteobacteria bacterium]|nr:TldD/PmbA family protein [Gammaproteobacteria bacterium]MBL6998385.1 TldD/PmbA family protein [Gammaproteobacteria bacterium]
MKTKQAVGPMEQLFNQLGSALMAELRGQESLALSFGAENSQFTRFNGSRIRQTGLVDDIGLSLDLIDQQRQASGSIALSGILQEDLQRVAAELARLRAEVSELPEDPYLVVPVAGQHSHSDQHAALLAPEQSGAKLLPAMQGLDLSGLWTSGRIYQGHLNSAGSRHWFASDSFVLDYSLLNPDERMLKACFAGTDWQQSEYEQSLQASAQQLKMLQRPAIRIQPGHYRAYIASAGVADMLDMFSWNGLSESAMQTGESAFLRMRSEGIRLSALFSLAQDFSSGLAPRFNQYGEMAPERIALISAGELKHCLTSSRTASEFGVASSFADDSEALQLPVMATGTLAEADILAALGTGVYLSNLHYLNWSDVAAGRITGMTRYACFWVEDGEIQGPLESMRFDDSFYHFFGDHLEAVGAESQMNPNVGSYGGRELGMTQCPGVLLSSFALTL